MIARITGIGYTPALPPEGTVRVEPRSDVLLDLDRLLRLRLVVARHGEMDRARWWNTQGMLGPHGVTVMARGFPRTHWFAQARVVFAVARSRCREVFSPPGCLTLWSLPAGVEDAFEDAWTRWTDDATAWTPTFQRISGGTGGSLLDTLRSEGLVNDGDAEAVNRLHRSAESRAVMLPGLYRPNDEAITLLAAGFALGEVGAPVIPYARIEE